VRRTTAETPGLRSGRCIYHSQFMRILGAAVLGALLVASSARADVPASQPAQPAVPAPAPVQGQYAQQGYPPPPPPPPPAQGAPAGGYGTYPGAPPGGYGTYPGAPPTGYGAYPAQPAPQYYPPPPQGGDRIHRGGLMLGFAVGGGAVRFSDEGRNGFAYTFDLGAMLNNNLALLFDVSGLSHGAGYSEDESHTIVGGVARVFFLKFLWAQAGLGLGHIATSDAWGYTIASTESSLAGIVGAGAELLQTTGGFSLDVQVRVAGARYQDVGRAINTSLLVGFNFY
jgi:hypothetical protein